MKSPQGFTPIPSHPDYAVDKDGNVYSSKADRLLTPHTEQGYKRVSIRSGKEYKVKVHRIVAETYIPNPNQLPQVNHIDGDKTNNTVANLEWVSAKENMRHAHRTGLVSVKKASESSCEVRRRKVMGTCIATGLVIKADSLVELCSKYNLIVSNVSACCLGKRRTHKGYAFQFIT